MWPCLRRRRRWRSSRSGRQRSRPSPTRWGGSCITSGSIRTRSCSRSSTERAMCRRRRRRRSSCCTADGTGNKSAKTKGHPCGWPFVLVDLKGFTPPGHKPRIPRSTTKQNHPCGWFIFGGPEGIYPSGA